jgi:hypothetical protein
MATVSVAFGCPAASDHAGDAATGSRRRPSPVVPGQAVPAWMQSYLQHRVTSKKTSNRGSESPVGTGLSELLGPCDNGEDGPDHKVLNLLLQSSPDSIDVTQHINAVRCATLPSSYSDRGLKGQKKAKPFIPPPLASSHLPSTLTTTSVQRALHACGMRYDALSSMTSDVSIEEALLASEQADRQCEELEAWRTSNTTAAVLTAARSATVQLADRRCGSLELARTTSGQSRVSSRSGARAPSSWCIANSLSAAATANILQPTAVDKASRRASGQWHRGSVAVTTINSRLSQPPLHQALPQPSPGDFADRSESQDEVTRSDPGPGLERPALLQRQGTKQLEFQRLLTTVACAGVVLLAFVTLVALIPL